MTVLEIVTANVSHLNLTEAQIQQSVDEVAMAIKNYCNIASIPSELIYVQANMAEDLLRYRKARREADQGLTVAPSNTDVTDLKIGDTNIKLVAGSNVPRELKAHALTVDRLIMDYQSQLNGFRRMVW